MNLYELIGFIIGDGNIYYNLKSRVYRLELAGNVEEDYDYFDKIDNFLFKETGRKPIKFIRNEKKGKSLRIQFNNKQFVDLLLSLGLSKGMKTFSVEIPNDLVKDKKMFSIIRGIFEADGCLYFSKSKKMKYPSYPRLEIRTSSKNLMVQIKKFLEDEGFNVYVKKGRTFAIQISGEKMLNLWIDKIGFPSMKNITKYKIWKTKGFYIPNTPLKNRLIECAGGTAATAFGCSPKIPGFESQSALI